ncbi:MAG: hypothetical protein HY337_04305 [Gemmatimonadetes bacterium]|jgi:hypothetical protein|nr:hypothetical protein [Gemmatimonadota bacterium]
MAAEKLKFTHAGRTFECWVDAQGEVAGGLSRLSSPMWVVAVDGVAHAPFDATPDDTTEDVRRKIVEWYDAEKGGGSA